MTSTTSSLSKKFKVYPSLLLTASIVLSMKVQHSSSTWLDEEFHVLIQERNCLRKEFGSNRCLTERVERGM